MGRQIQVLLDRVDEQQLLERFRLDGEVRLFESFAPNPDALWVDQLAPMSVAYIWPVRYPWAPIYGVATTGAYYVRNTATAPIVEYFRAPADQSRPGRLYWSKSFAGDPLYDAEDFGRWVDDLFRWVRRTAKRGSIAGYAPVWIFPSAHASSGSC